MRGRRGLCLPSSKAGRIILLKSQCHRCRPVYGITSTNMLWDARLTATEVFPTGSRNLYKSAYFIISTAPGKCLINMFLTGLQRKELHEALLSAFNLIELEMLVQFT